MGRRTGDLIAFLEHAASPATAIQLGHHLGLGYGGHETRRRFVRRQVAIAREDGHRICSDGEGYWMARSAREWQAFLEAQKSAGRFKFCLARDWAEAATDACNRQSTLFDARPTPAEQYLARA